MKRINLRGLQEKLSAKELKNVLGGSAGSFCKGLCGVITMCMTTGMNDIGYCKYNEDEECVCIEKTK